ncbi:MAG: cytochrome c biogenesis protein CcsA [Candidatus Odinarchaeota archaeon]
MKENVEKRQGLTVLPIPLIVLAIGICFTAVNYWLVYISVESMQGEGAEFFNVSGHPIFYMVPFAFSAYLCFGVVLLGGLLYLLKKDLKYDLFLLSGAQVGVITAGLTILIGMIWAYVEWGYFWQWEPRETATLIMWLAIAGLLIFREMLDVKDHEKKATISAIFGIIASPSVPLTYFVQGALHYGGGEVLTGGLGPGVGPVLMMNFLLIGALTLALIYITYRTNNIDLKLKEIRSAKMAAE